MRLTVHTHPATDLLDYLRDKYEFIETHHLNETYLQLLANDELLAIIGPFEEIRLVYADLCVKFPKHMISIDLTPIALNEKIPGGITFETAYRLEAK